MDFIDEKTHANSKTGVAKNCAYCRAPIVHALGPNDEFCCHSCELLSDWFNKGEAPLSLNSSKKVSSKWQPFTYSDLESEYDLAKSQKDQKQFRFYIEGLQCTSCVHLLEDLPKFYPGIKEARLNYGRRTLDVSSEKNLTLGEVAQAIESLGYTAHPLQHGSLS